VSSKTNARRKLNALEARPDFSAPIDYRSVLMAKLDAMADNIARHGGWASYEPGDIVTDCTTRIVAAETELAHWQAKATALLNNGPYPITADTNDRRRQHRKVIADSARAAARSIVMLERVRVLALGDGGRPASAVPTVDANGYPMFVPTLSSMSLAELVALAATV